MVAYTRARLERVLKFDFLRFCIVGGTGFLINFVLLIFFTKYLHLHVAVAQFIGAEVALFSNFLLHHHWTYKSKKVKKSMSTLLIQFHLTSWPAIVGSTLMVSVGVEVFHLSKLSALLISSFIALIWNFVWSKYVVWKGVGEKEIEEIV